ncbi:hypothetical protein [Acinetobacter baumannii]|uniref:hypothetical protein n=1 Tax=Acinetobacter baumannii TaxID=470 RepID=UPI003D04A1DA
MKVNRTKTSASQRISHFSSTLIRPADAIAGHLFHNWYTTCVNNQKSGQGILNIAFLTQDSENVDEQNANF